MTPQQLQGMIGHLQRQYAALQQAYESGILKTLHEMKESQEKVAEAIAYNAETLKAMQGLATNQGAVYAEQIPGKREPRWVTKDITIPAGSTTTVADDQPLSATGPMEATELRGVAKMSVPVSSDGGNPGTITRQIRFRPISSLFDPLASPNPAAATQPSYTPDITVNGCCDFLFKYQTARSSRQRMNVAIPSVYLGVERPLYFSCGDLWAASDAIQYEVTPLFASFAWIGGVPGPGGAAVVDTAQPVTINLTFGCILYAQNPSYTP